MKTAIILGATGLTGSILLEKLLEDNRYSKIKLFSRSSAGVNNDKIEEHLVDLFELEKHSKDFNADEVFCCIGTTQAKTPDEETYYKIDHGIPVTAAKLAKQNNISRFLVISALGADVESRFFYNRTKGEMERDVLAQGIAETYLMEPSFITGKRKENRSLEAVGGKVMGVANHLLVGPLKKYRSIHAGTIADAMIYVANNVYSGDRIKSDEIREIAEAYR
ncbi:NAD(P)H-binding protein [Salinimicrobium sp. CDJ15-81-2]|nr:NAD(P)H-binding protein [Salinimicrobium nanhaiense]